MTNTLFTFLFFWAIFLVVPLFVDGSTAVAYLVGAWAEVRRRKKRPTPQKLSFFPTVTVIIPIHNGAPYLRACISSIREQSYPGDKLEVFVIDNLSQDNSFAVFSEEQAQPFAGRLEWVSIPQRGKAYALNAGIHVSSGEYIVNIDCDVVLHRDAILNMVKAFKADTSMAAATGAVEILPVDSDNNMPKHILGECEFMEYYTSFSIGRQYQSLTNSLFTLSGAFSAFRRDILLNTFMYDRQTVSEDTKMTFELHRRFKKLKKACIPEAKAYTAPTSSLSALYSQRVRWQRGQLEVSAVFPEQVRSPLTLTGLSSSKSLVVDHTMAFGRVAWTFLLPMLYFIGYPLNMVISATLILYLCQMLVEAIYIGVCYKAAAEPEVKLRVKRDWWLFAIMPVYRFIIFWFRLGGFVTVLTEPASWTAQNPVKQLSNALGKSMQRIRNAFVR